MGWLSTVECRQLKPFANSSTQKQLPLCTLQFRGCLFILVNSNFSISRTVMLIFPYGSPELFWFHRNYWSNLMCKMKYKRFSAKYAFRWCFTGSNVSCNLSCKKFATKLARKNYVLHLVGNILGTEISCRFFVTSIGKMPVFVLCRTRKLHWAIFSRKLDRNGRNVAHSVTLVHWAMQYFLLINFMCGCLETKNKDAMVLKALLELWKAVSVGKG